MRYILLLGIVPLLIIADQALPILRWWVPWVGSKQKLQQKWKKDDGTYEWRNVPTELNWKPEDLDKQGETKK